MLRQRGLLVLPTTANSEITGLKALDLLLSPVTTLQQSGLKENDTAPRPIDNLGPKSRSRGKAVSGCDRRCDLASASNACKQIPTGQEFRIGFAPAFVQFVSHVVAVLFNRGGFV